MQCEKQQTPYGVKSVLDFFTPDNNKDCVMHIHDGLLVGKVEEMFLAQYSENSNQSTNKMSEDSRGLFFCFLLISKSHNIKMMRIIACCKYLYIFILLYV